MQILKTKVHLLVPLPSSSNHLRRPTSSRRVVLVDGIHRAVAPRLEDGRAAALRTDLGNAAVRHLDALLHRVLV